MAQGKPGAPKGNKNGSHDKPWADAIRRALLANDGQKLRALAEKLVERGVGGDVAAIREIGDRIDGKPKQEVAAEVKGDLKVEIVRFSKAA